ncbi:MAG: hypothetical protein ACK40Q_05450 [Pseudothermotoga sp.]
MGTIEFEPGLKKDLPEILNKLIQPEYNTGKVPNISHSKLLKFTEQRSFL